MRYEEGYVKRLEEEIAELKEKVHIAAQYGDRGEHLKQIAELKAILAEDKQEYLKLIKIHGVDAIREVIDFCELSGNQHAARCVKKYADNLEKVNSSS